MQSSFALDGSRMLLTSVQDAWRELCDCFAALQRSNTSREHAAVAATAALVERNLCFILDALRTEHRTLLRGRGRAAEGDVHHGMLAEAASAAPAALVAARLPPCYRYLFDVHNADVVAVAAASVKDEGNNNNDKEAVASVTTQQRSRTASVLCGSVDEDVRPCTASGEQDDTQQLPVAIGAAFLPLLCAQATRDTTGTVRRSLLRFLTRLLLEADLCSDGSGSGSSHATSQQQQPALSLLLLHPDTSLVPLCYMLCEVSGGARLAAHTQASRSLSPLASATSAAITAASRSTRTETTLLRDRQDATAASSSSSSSSSLLQGEELRGGVEVDERVRVLVARLACVLAERIERLPALAAVCVVRTSSSSSSSSTTSTPLQLLLQTVLPYVTTHHGATTSRDASGARDRSETSRYALAAVCALARCGHVRVQRVVGQQRELCTRTLAGVRTTLLTLCKVPDNDDGAVQLRYVGDVLRCWAALTAASSAVARRVGVCDALHELVATTLLPLLQSRDTHVYASACLVVAHVLQSELAASWLTVAQALARALLCSRVDGLTGRVDTTPSWCDATPLLHCGATATMHDSMSEAEDDGDDDDDSNNDNKDDGSDVADAAVRAARVATVAATHHNHCSSSSDNNNNKDKATVSFLDYYVVPRLTHRPALTDEDVVHRAVLGFALTRWTATEASLVLLNALVTVCPCTFMRTALDLDMCAAAHVAVAGHTAHDDDHDDNTGDGSNNKSTTTTTAVRTHTTKTATATTAAATMTATTTLPPVDLVSCFSTYLYDTHTSRASRALVGHEVLERLLRIEGNTPAAALHQRACAVNEQCRALSLHSPPPAHDAVPRHDVRVTSNNSNSDNNDKTDDAVDVSVRDEAWMHRGVHMAAVTTALCELLAHAIRLPARVVALLTDVLLSVCVLPDLRVLYTLLDRDYGRLDHAMHALRARIDAVLESDVAMMTQTATAATTTRQTLSSSPTRASHGSSASSAHAEGSHATLSSSTGFWRRWVSSSSSSSTAHSSPPSQQPPSSSAAATHTHNSSSNNNTYSTSIDDKDADDVVVTAADGQATTTRTTTTGRRDVVPRAQLYARYARALHETGRHAAAMRTCTGLVTNEEVALLQTCSVVAGFYAELDAAIGYTALSHSLLHLRLTSSSATRTRTTTDDD